MLLSNAQVKSELHDVTRQFFTRHKFETWGEALQWMHTEDYKVRDKEAGSLGYSELSTEILWLVSLFGPNEKVDWDVVRIRSVPSLDTTTVETKPVGVTQTPRRRPRRRCY